MGPVRADAIQIIRIIRRHKNERGCHQSIQTVQLFEKVCADAEKCSCWYCLGGCLMKSVRLLCAGGVKLSIRCMVSLKMMNIFYFFKKKVLVL